MSDKDNTAKAGAKADAPKADAKADVKAEGQKVERTPEQLAARAARREAENKVPETSISDQIQATRKEAAAAQDVEKQVRDARENRPRRQPLDDMADADPTGMTKPNQFGTSADAASEVDMPATKIRETEAGTEIRPEIEAETLPNATQEELDLRAQQLYGRHSGKVGHAVPIVDDYTVNNPRQGGTIGGAGGPGAVGRMKAELTKDKMAKSVIESLAKGVNAEKVIEEDDATRAAAEKSGKTAYRVVGGAIFTEAGKQSPGSKAYLSRDEAKRFDGLGRLAPWID